MYSVRIVYPNKPGSTFDWQHYYDVHLPLGIRLLREYRGIAPAEDRGRPANYLRR